MFTHHSARLEDGGVGLAPLKTAGTYRTVPLPEVVGDALATHLTRFSPHPDLGSIFTTGGGPVQQHPWAEVWATARKRAGVPSGPLRTTSDTIMRAWSSARARP